MLKPKSKGSDVTWLHQNRDTRLVLLWMTYPKEEEHLFDILR